MENNRYFNSGFAVGAVFVAVVFLALYSARPELFMIQAPPAPAPVCPPAPAPKCGPSTDILPPPTYSENLPEELETNREAEVRVAWDEVPGAKGYRVYVTDRTGRLVKKYSTSRTTIYLKDIPAPEDVAEVNYTVALATANADDKEGERGEMRPLKVNRQSSVVAPTIKRIVIED